MDQRKLLSLILAIVMCLSLFPAGALADELPEEQLTELSEEPMIEEPSGVNEMEQLFSEEPETELSEETADELPENDITDELKEETDDVPADQAETVEELAENINGEELPTEIVESAEEVPEEEIEEEAGVDEAIDALIEADIESVPSNEIIEENGLVIEHGFSGQTMLLGVYDTDYPVISDFQIVEDGQTLKAGDTVHVILQAYDSDYIRQCWLNLCNLETGYKIYIPVEYNETTSRFEGEYLLSEINDSGTYFADYFYAEDFYGFSSSYSSYSSDAFRVMQQYFPGTVTVAIEKEPELLKPVIQEDGKTLHPGDTAHLSLNLSAFDSVDFIGIGLTTPIGVREIYLDDMSLDENTGIYSYEYTFTKENFNGIYSILDMYVFADGQSFQYSYSVPDGTAPKIYLDGAVSASEVLLIQEDGQTLHPGDTVHLSVNLPDNMIADYFCVGLKTPAGDQTIMSGDMIFDENTGIYSYEYTFSEEDFTGTYYISDFYSEYEQNAVIVFEYLDSDGIGPTVYLKGARDIEKQIPAIYDIVCDQNGKTLTDGDTVKIRFKVDSEEWVWPYVYLMMTSPLIKPGSNIKYERPSEIFLEAQYDEKTETYEASYTFGDNDVYGVYSAEIDYQDASGYTYHPTDILFRFAESREEELKRLAPAVELQWDDLGFGHFTLPDYHFGEFMIETFKKVGKGSESVSCMRYLDIDWIDTQEIGLQVLSTIQNFESGDYYFTVTVLGDGENYYDSLAAVSPVRSFSATEDQLAPVTSIEWKKHDDGYYIALIQGPDDPRCSEIGIEWYFSEIEEGTPEYCNWSFDACYDPEFDAYVGYIYDELIDGFGNGYYYCRARACAESPTIAKSSEWIMGPGIKLTSKHRAVENFVIRMYDICLNRTPDQSGFEGWVENLENGYLTGTEVASSFIFSDEFKANNYCNSCYLDHLYEAYMGREPDAGGKAGWLEQLDKRYMTREAVFNGFAMSTEFGEICSEYGINRGSKVEEPKHGTEPTGKCLKCGAATWTGADDFVVRLYKVCLDREPDEDGRDGWSTQLKCKEMTGKQVAHSFVFSSEFIEKGYNNTQFMEHLYQALLGRNADSGISGWVEQLEKGYMSREELFNSFARTDEFTGLCESYGINRG